MSANVSATSIAIVSSKIEGAPTAIFQPEDGPAFYLHSRHDPVEEARFLVKDVARQERTLYVVLGFGLGYHVKELLEGIPQSSHVLVVEPEWARLSQRTRHDRGVDAWMHNSRLHVYASSDATIVPLHLVEYLAELKLLSVSLLPHIPSMQTSRAFYQAVASEIPRDLPAAVRSHLRWFDETLENSLGNFWANLPDSWRAAPVQRLRDKWSKRPLVIVSAGPSLDEGLPVLSRLSAKALILATGTAARILADHEIRPDLVVSIDPYEWNRAHFSGWESSDVPLVYYHRICRGIVSEYAGPKFCFVMHDESPIPLRQSRERSPFFRGGTVAYSALQLAHYMDADPIIFVGQDFAFARGRTHAAGALYGDAFDDRALPEDYFHVPGVDGQPVVTNRTYYGYLTLMQDYLRTFAARQPDVRHINTSATGAKIGGMESADLAHVLGVLPDLPRRPRDQIARAFKPGDSSSWTQEKAAMDRWVGEIDRLTNAGATDFEHLFASFRATDAYAQASKSYDGISWVYESKYRNVSAEERVSFSNRFTSHLRFVADALRAASGRGIGG